MGVPINCKLHASQGARTSRTENNIRTRRHGFVSRSDLELIEVGLVMVTFVTRCCQLFQVSVQQVGDTQRDLPMVESACFHISSPPKTSSTSLRTSLVLDVILYSLVQVLLGASLDIWLTCLVIGNSQAPVGHAHLLWPVSEDIIRMFAQLGQKSIFIVSSWKLNRAVC